MGRKGLWERVWVVGVEEVVDVLVCFMLFCVHFWGF
jgi:hypothetical protein